MCCLAQKERLCLLDGWLTLQREGALLLIPALLSSKHLGHADEELQMCSSWGKSCPQRQMELQQSREELKYVPEG